MSKSMIRDYQQINYKQRKALIGYFYFSYLSSHHLLCIFSHMFIIMISISHNDYIYYYKTKMYIVFLRILRDRTMDVNLSNYSIIA